MDPRLAAARVNTLAMPPNVVCQAERYSDHEVVVRVAWPEHPDSDEREAPYYDGPRIMPYRSYIVDVGALDQDELAGRVIDCIDDAWLHEVREFVRYDDGQRWRAPFHPHRPEGDRAWQARGGRPRPAHYERILV